MWQFEKYVDTEGKVMVLLPEDMGAVEALANPEREEWRVAALKEFSDDEDLTAFVEHLCSAMEKFLAEE